MPKRDEYTSHPFRFGSRRAKQKDWDLLFSSKGFLLVREASKPDKPVADFIFKFELNIAPFAVSLSNSSPAATVAGQMDEKIDRMAFIGKHYCWPRTVSFHARTKRPKIGMWIVDKPVLYWYAT